MSTKSPFEPYDSFKKYSETWEKQINDFIFLLSNNNEFVKMAKAGTDAQTKYLETFKKNQETLAGVLNIPTKNDLANVTSLTIQTEEKIESLEEQIWNLQDSLKSQSKDIEIIVEVSKEIIKLTKQLKTELGKTKKELANSKDIQSELQEIKFELNRLTNLKEDIELLKSHMKNDEHLEQVLTVSGSTNDE
ncbi:polyhydroxyalkanoate biosynthesis repressor PhaR [Neobacillus sp. DY30]|uniref:polyhydroxyalkanoate biosynthesis repressor PhaR n=1 Tax=Neobacillus sp. DY30 TaxID=3047871 RepID=UPI0024BF53EF|nr:polyhydroxyalkanoate biosynthesis repressor PhaR [Neobacillus sp. DY30]WHY02137.1 polyhydroxyalkanoate biosynthesis repressor PhaR [Neobacillus sp. DY30]